MLVGPARPGDQDGLGGGDSQGEPAVPKRLGALASSVLVTILRPGRHGLMPEMSHQDM